METNIWLGLRTRPRGVSTLGMGLRLLTAVAATITARPALACSVCGCGDPLLTSSDPAALTGSLRVQFDTEFLRVDAGTDGRPGFTDELTQVSYRLNVAFRPVEDLSLAATLPFTSKMIRTVGGGTVATDSDLTGLGDVEVGARYALWRTVQVGAQRMQELALGAGTSMPTGPSNAKMADGSLVDPHGQLGTGGWGPFAGLYYRFEQGDWTAFASLSYRLRTPGTYFDRSQYRFGDAFLWSAHGQYRAARRVALDLGVDGRYATADWAKDSSGVVTSQVDNTGGTLLSAAPGVYVDAAAGLWVFARGQVPFLKHLFGQQDVKPSFTVGLQYQLR
jgi:hypothetical protein